MKLTIVHLLTLLLLLLALFKFSIINSRPIGGSGSAIEARCIDEVTGRSVIVVILKPRTTSFEREG